MDKIEVHISGKRSGRTTAIINTFMLDPENSMIACFSEQEADRVRRLIIDRYPATMKSMFGDDEGAQRKFLEGHVASASAPRKGQNYKVYVDNADLILRMLYGDVRVAVFEG